MSGGDQLEFDRIVQEFRGSYVSHYIYKVVICCWLIEMCTCVCVFGVASTKAT